jgi:hypothetical protein
MEIESRGTRLHLEGNLEHDEAREQYLRVFGPQSDVRAWNFIRFVKNNGELTETHHSEIGPDDHVVTAVEPIFLDEKNF